MSDNLIERLSRMRYNNANGKVIPLHHAFRTVYTDAPSIAATVALSALFLLLIWFLLPLIVEHWANVMEFWAENIFNANIAYESRGIMGQEIRIPYPEVNAYLPTKNAVWINLIICVLALIGSLFLPKRLAPVVYFIRAMLVIQGSASIDRLITPDYFPYTLKEYIVDAMTLCSFLMLVIPLILALIYFIFDFGLWRKCLLVFLMIAYYLMFVPCQYMLHTLILSEWTVLFMPLTYMFFGTLIDVLMFIAIYSYGMSWNSHKVRMHGRDV